MSDRHLEPSRGAARAPQSPWDTEPAGCAAAAAAQAPAPSTSGPAVLLGQGNGREGEAAREAGWVQPGLLSSRKEAKAGSS